MVSAENEYGVLCETPPKVPVGFSHCYLDRSDPGSHRYNVGTEIPRSFATSLGGIRGAKPNGTITYAKDLKI